MDSKEQARKKAFKCLSDLAEGPYGLMLDTIKLSTETGYQDAYRVKYNIDDSKGHFFPYAPPRKAPPKGTIVEGYGIGDGDKAVGYSSGKADENGFLKIHQYSQDDGSSFANKFIMIRDWRVVGGENERCLKDEICHSCKHMQTNSNYDPCKSCYVSMPTNYEHEAKNDK